LEKLSLSEVKSAWAAYEATDAFSVLKDGKWRHEPIKYQMGMALPKPEGTACKVGKLSKVMDFPEYIEKHWVK
jgi:hypothetical protein